MLLNVQYVSVTEENESPSAPADDNTIAKMHQEFRTTTTRETSDDTDDI